MRVLVTFAVDAEFAPWRKLRAFRYIDYDGLQLWRTDAGTIQITVLLTGIGTESSAQAMGLMMQRADETKHFDVCVSSGLAGALDEALMPGDIIAPQLLIAENKHAEAPSEQLKVHPELRKQAVTMGAIAADCLLTSNQVMAKASAKRACSSKAQSVDMESFEIVKEAQAWGAQSVGQGRPAPQFQCHAFEKAASERVQNCLGAGQESSCPAGGSAVRSTKPKSRRKAGALSRRLRTNNGERRPWKPLT